MRKELKLVLMWFYNLNSLGDLSSAVLRNEIFFTRDVKPYFRQISEWNLQITWNFNGLLVNKDHLVLLKKTVKRGEKEARLPFRFFFFSYWKQVQVLIRMYILISGLYLTALSCFDTIQKLGMLKCFAHLFCVNNITQNLFHGY